jgi:hypothetical protein
LVGAGGFGRRESTKGSGPPLQGPEQQFERFSGLVLERFETEGLAQLSYIVGDDAAGRAAVIDPRRDIDVYPQSDARPRPSSHPHL